MHDTGKASRREIQAGIGSSRRRLLLACGLIVILAAYAAHALYFRHYVNDDAYITFRYSRFLAEGHGPYFNLSEHVEGYTNFLLVLLLAPVIFLGGEASAPVAAKTIGIVSGAVAVVAAFLLAARLAREESGGSWLSGIAGLVAAGLVVVSPGFALNSISGLETSLFAACLISGLLLGAESVRKGRWCGSGLAFGAAVLTRPEGILLFAVYWCAQASVMTLALRARARGDFSRGMSGVMRTDAFRRHLLPDGVIVTAVLVGHLVFRLLAYDGEWLPNTYFAKSGGFWRVDAWRYINEGLLASCLGVVGVLAACMGWIFATRSRRAAIPVIAVGVVGSLLPFVTGTDWMLGWRLSMPFLPIVVVLVAIGWCRLANRLIKKPVWLAALLVLALLPVSWFTQGRNRAAFHERTAIRAKGYENGHTALANWLRHEAARPGDTIALMDIGIIGYLCSEQKILDITGLTDRFIARSPGTFLDKKYDVDYILDRNPEYVVLAMEGGGASDVNPRAELSLTPWTNAEVSLWRHPDFQRRYVRKRGIQTAARRTLRGIAAGLGAERVFQHDYPGRYYLLAVFKRREVTES